MEWKDGVVKVQSEFFGEMKLRGEMVLAIEFVLKTAKSVEKKPANTKVEHAKWEDFPDIIFAQDDAIDMDNLDGVPKAWNLGSGKVFKPLKNNPNLPKLNR